MKFTVSDFVKLENIPSGSGIARSADNYYVVGDDSPFLFLLNKDFQTISKTPLLDASNFPDGRIVKSKKPDFEALELIGENELVVFGSGSKSPERDVFMRILLGENLITAAYDVSDFYNKLRKLSVFQNSELNIEAAAFHEENIYLFNRKKNLILKFDYQDLLAYIKSDAEFIEPDITEFYLPKINGVEAGFSGATTLKDEPKLIFTASVENTDNAYDDGQIFGSIIGVIDISNGRVSDNFECCKVLSNDTHLKVESVTVVEEISSGKTKVVLITDDDLGNSIILKGMLLW